MKKIKTSHLLMIIICATAPGILTPTCTTIKAFRCGTITEYFSFNRRHVAYPMFIEGTFSLYSLILWLIWVLWVPCGFVMFVRVVRVVRVVEVMVIVGPVLTGVVWANL